VVQVRLGASARVPAPTSLHRFAATAACGVCGKGQLTSLEERGCTPLDDDVRVGAALLASLPERLRRHQPLFARTGGLHAAGLFTADGRLLAAREDVGRHNALDKVLGWALLGGVPLAGTLSASAAGRGTSCCRSASSPACPCSPRCRPPRAWPSRWRAGSASPSPPSSATAASTSTPARSG
jgi:formate dehydrogenase accessory protein FdhD